MSVEAEVSNENVQEVAEEKVTKVTISGLLKDLENGLTRKEIREKYNWTMQEQKHVFQHPKLKNKKAHKKTTTVNITLVDDLDEGQDAGVDETDKDVTGQAGTDFMPDPISNEDSVSEVEAAEAEEDYTLSEDRN